MRVKATLPAGWLDCYSMSFKVKYRLTTKQSFSGDRIIFLNSLPTSKPSEDDRLARRPAYCHGKFCSRQKNSRSCCEKCNVIGGNYMRPGRTHTGTNLQFLQSFTWDRDETLRWLHETGTNSKTGDSCSYITFLSRLFNILFTNCRNWYTIYSN